MENIRLCQYQDIFGKPGEGVHKYRLWNMPVVDVLATIIGAFILAKLFNMSFLHTLIGLFVLGIFLHWLFCVKTPVTEALFGTHADPSVPTPKPPKYYRERRHGRYSASTTPNSM